MVKAFLLGLMAIGLMWTMADVSMAAPEAVKKVPAAKPVVKPSPVKSKVVSLLIDSFNGDTDYAAISAAIKTSKQETASAQQAMLPKPAMQNKPLVSNKSE